MSRALAKARLRMSEGEPMAKTYTVLVLAPVTQTSIVEDVRQAICEEVSIGRDCNFRWTPSKEPMSLSASKWGATGSAIVDDLQGKYPALAVKRTEIRAHHGKQLTAFRVFLTNRIKKPA